MGNEKKRHVGGKKCLQKGESERGNEKKWRRGTQDIEMRAEKEGSARKVKEGKERCNTHTHTYSILLHYHTQTPSRLHIDADIHTHEVTLLYPSVSVGCESHIQIFILSCLSKPRLVFL